MKGIEVSCTAGITEDGEWIRLFPVPYRFMDPDKRFRKYQWITATVRKANDARPESFHPELDTIQTGEVLDTRDKWRKRKELVLPLKSHCLCCLKADRDRDGSPTLGLFKPRQIRRLLIEADDPNWTPDQLAAL